MPLRDPLRQATDPFYTGVKGWIPVGRLASGDNTGRRLSPNWVLGYLQRRHIHDGKPARVVSDQAAGLARYWARPSAGWLDDRVWRLSASKTTVRATATAPYRLGAMTVTTLMILSAR
jgi:hypothetical protein